MYQRIDNIMVADDPFIASANKDNNHVSIIIKKLNVFDIKIIFFNQMNKCLRISHCII